MKHFLLCTETFFEVANDYFKFALIAAPIQRQEGLYRIPNIYAALESETLPSNEKCNNMNDYCQILFIHELCHIFRNFINRDYDLINMVDHGLTFKSFVSLDDLETEIEVLTLQEYILRKTDSRFFRNKELYTSIHKLNNRVPNGYDSNSLNDIIQFKEKCWHTIGINGLREQFQGMIEDLKENLDNNFL